MNRRAIILGLSATWTGALRLFAAAALMAPIDPPKPAPDLQFVDGDGKNRSLADFKGKVILLNAWATWCVPCRKEMPALDRLQGALGGQDFEVLALSIDRKGMEAVTAFYTEIGIQHLDRYLAPSGNDAMDKLGVFGIPATYLIDRQGNIIAQKQGPAEWDAPGFVAFFKDIIAKSKETTP
jgi:thiol-disulfide isomerase/thioredoxin